MSLAVQIEKPGGGEKRILRYGDTVFEYTLFRRELGKKKVVLTVPPNGELVVTAAESIPLAQVEDVIRQRARWILETRETFAEPALSRFLQQKMPQTQLHQPLQ